MPHIFKTAKRFFALMAIAWPLLFAVMPAAAQENNAVLSGFVTDSLSKETLIGATVLIEGTKLGSYTNKSGFFSVKNIPPGEYTVTVRFIGYGKISRKITFGPDESVRRDFMLAQLPTEMQKLEVYGEKDNDKTEISVSKVNIPITQIKEIRIGGESDIFRAIQTLPGVLTSSQISSGLYIRGGSPDQNLVLLDGATVYNPTHIFGFISAFNTDALKDVELIKGGFPAEFGGRLSSVLNITQMDGNKEKVEGIGSVGAISSKLSVEGPIGDGSWFLSGRRTYFELIKAMITEDPANPIPDFNFYDVNAKIMQNFGENDKVFLSGFRSADNLAFAAQGASLALELANLSGSLKWTHVFGGDLFTNVLVSGSTYTNNFNGEQTGYEFLIDNSITDYTLKANAEWFTSEKITTKFGFEGNLYTFKYLQNFTGDTDSTAQGSEGGFTNFSVNDLNYAAFAQANIQFNDDVSVQAGLRGTYFELAQQFTLDPRLAMRWQASEDITLKASWGIFHQNLKLASQPDFSFFDTWLGTDSSLNISRSMHYILSMQTMPWEDYNFNVDVYYKTLDKINELNRFALEIDNGADALYEGTGYSYGLELFLQKKVGDFTGWVGYGLGFIYARFDSINSGREFRPKYDRRHDFKAVVQWTIDDTWDAGANFMFQTGQSYTGQTSIWRSNLPGDEYGRYKTFPSQRYGLRLPASHQLNVNVSYKFDLWGAPARLILDVYNLYNRRDIWFRVIDTDDDQPKYEDIRLLPVIPTISFEFRF